MANDPQFPGVQPLRPPMVGSVDHPRSFFPHPSAQFRPVLPAQLPQPLPVAPQQFQPGHGALATNIGLASQAPQFQFSQPMQQLPAGPGHPAHLPPPSQTMLMSNVQSNRPITSGFPQTHPHTQNSSNGYGGPGLPLSSSYTFAPSSQTLPQSESNHLTQHQLESQALAPNISTGELSNLSYTNQGAFSVTPGQHGEKVLADSTIGPAMPIQPTLAAQVASVWLEHTKADGRRYYYNRKTGKSTWEKPLELMTQTEKADASTNWKEYRSPTGKKYYNNKVTNESRWRIPDDLKVAREHLDGAAVKGVLSETLGDCSVSASAGNASVSAANPSSTTHKTAPSPITVTSVAAPDNLQPTIAPASADLLGVSSTLETDTVETTASENITSPIVADRGTAGVLDSVVNNVPQSMNNLNIDTAQNATNSLDEVSGPSVEKASSPDEAETVENSSLEVKEVDQVPSSYPNKHEAKNAFKALLESANFEPNWTWDQAMRVIINDKRYAALKSLGERKQAFNEFVGQKKKQEIEDLRARQKNARDEFIRMLEESRDLTYSTKWSKAIDMFEEDERFFAVERSRDREDLFKNYILEFEKKERAKAIDEHKRNITEYRHFLESCDFIKASSQWRKLKDRLEVDERCSRLDDLDRLEVFQEYLRDLEKEEEEQRKLEKEELRKAERKNRDEFRKLMERHVIDGFFNGKTQWREYCIKVKDLPEYLAVSLNSSGSTPKDLFEDVAEELQKQYREDKSRILDALNFGKVTLSSSLEFESFKASILEYAGTPQISDTNLKLLFNELIEREKEKEEKEAKKRKRLADEFQNLLQSTKEITASSKWDESKPLLKIRQLCRSNEEETTCKDVFEKYVIQFKEQIEESERKQRDEKAKRKKEREEREKRKAKRRREEDRTFGKEKGREQSKGGVTESEDVDVTDILVPQEDRSREKTKDKKHKSRHEMTLVDVNFNNRKNSSRNPHRHESEHRKLKQMKHAKLSPNLDNDSRHKRSKRQHQNSSRRRDNYNEDGEFG